MTVIAAIPMAQRQASAESPIVSPGWTAPNDITELRIRANIPTTDYEQAGNSFTIYYDVFDNGQWVPTGGSFGWTSPGGPYIGRGGVVNPPPTDFFPAVEYRGRTLRIRMVIPVRMRIGGEIVTEP